MNQLHINGDLRKQDVIDCTGEHPGLVRDYNYGLYGRLPHNKLNWTEDSDVLHKKGQSSLLLLRRLRSFGVKYIL